MDRGASQKFRAGPYSNATMLFGHTETLQDRIIPHVPPGNCRTKPTAFFPVHSARGYHLTGQCARTHQSRNKAGEEDILRTVAIARLFLDNFPYIKAAL